MKQKDLPFNIAILLVFLSAIVFILYRGIEERNRAEKAVKKEVEQTLRITDEKIDKFFDDVNMTLILLAGIPEIRSGGEEECNNYLRMFLRDYIQYVNFGVADANGNVICSAVSLGKPVNLSDRTYFLDAKEMHSFASGSYRMNRITQSSTVSFGYPILAGDSEVVRVVFASIDIGWFKKLIEGNTTQKDMTITIIDKNGTVLAREPEFEKWVGKPVANKPLIKVAMAKTEGSADLEGLDGVKRYYNFLPLFYGIGDNWYLTVGASEKKAVERVDKVFVRTISFLALTSLGMFVLYIIE